MRFAFAPILAVARADFLERIRGYSFLVTLLFAVYLGYAAGTGKIILRFDEYRGVYTAGWIGLLVSLVTTSFVSLIGFYIVKNAVDRDRITHVGEILAASPLSKFAYMLGKLASNFAVLASIVVVLAIAAIIMFLFAGEAPGFHAWALLGPFLLIAMPAMVITAAVALLFESLPFLRGGLGNVIWFFAWTFLIGAPEIFHRPWLDPIGLVSSLKSVQPIARAAIPNYHNNVSLNIGREGAEVARNLLFSGISWTREAILLRLLWFAGAIVLALFAALVFDRFDSARSVLPRLRGNALSQKNSAVGALEIASPGNRPPSEELRQQPSAGLQAQHLSALDRSARYGGFSEILIAELRLAVQGYRWWWYAVAAGLLVAEFATPLNVSRGPLLAVAWIWPTLVWSAMGARESRFAMRQLLFASRILPRQFFACWLAGVAVALLTAVGAAIRLLIAGELLSVAALLAGALFIPSLAIALGIISGSSKFFEGLYAALWYVGPLNHAPGFDFTGATPGPRMMHYTLFYFGIAGLLLTIAYLTRSRQLQDS